MSVEAITWALKAPVPASSAKFVLVVLANQANDETGLAFPSVKYLSDATGQDRKTIIANLAKLVKWGLIEDTGDRVGRTRQVIVYRLVKDSALFTEQSQKRNSPKNGTVPFFLGKSTVFPRKQSQKRDTEPLINHQEPEKQEPVRSPSGSRLPADWRLPSDWRSWATAERPDVDPDREAAAFADYWHGVAGAKARKADWQATWRNWIRRADATQRPRAGPPVSQAMGKQMQGLMALEERKRELQQRMAGNRNPDGAAEAVLSIAGPHSSG